MFVSDILSRLLAHYPWLKMPFDGSLFPAFSINFGPWSISVDHRDSQNAPGVPCSITALGDFDPTRGGHLILFDYGLVIEFPPGSTAQILSGCVRHGNTQILPGEKRFSMIQYMAGGLWRHVAYGFRLTDQLSKTEVDDFERTASSRLQEVVSLFSTITSVVKDRIRLQAK
jgi:hypothetical protein